MAGRRVGSAVLLAASLASALISILLLSRPAFPSVLLLGCSDPKCASSIKGLVAKAASLCASDPECICDWTNNAQECFFKVRLGFRV